MGRVLVRTQALHISESTLGRNHICVRNVENALPGTQPFFNIRESTQVKPYECKDCEKGFMWNSDLAQHQKVHTGEKSHECTDCRKSFICKAHLIRHQRIHTGKRPYKCNDCGKVFSQNSVLIKHQRCHAREKPCNCQTSHLEP